MIWLLACAVTLTPHAAPTRVPTVPEGGYTGNAACTACHAQEARIWSTSMHAHAWSALEAAQSTFNPSCVPCHAVGFRAGGWPAEGFDNVGCEACHGPAAAHVAALTAPYPTPEPRCTGCHTPGTSPGFDQTKSWKLIAH